MNKKKLVLKLIITVLISIACAVCFEGFVKSTRDLVRPEMNAKTLGQYRKEYDTYFSDAIDVGKVKLKNYMKYKNASVDSSSNRADTVNLSDGKIGSKWISNRGGNGQYLMICLGNVYDISRLYIAWYVHSASEYRIELSMDGSNFYSLGNVVTGGYKKTDEILFGENTKAAYIRISMLKQKQEQIYELCELSVFGSDEEKKEAQFAGAKRYLSNLELMDYHMYTGRYFVYFTEQTDADKYDVFVDGKPVKTVSGSGEYIDSDELGKLAEGEHKLSVKLQNERIQVFETETTFDYKTESKNYNDISQIYIYTNDSITDDYLEDTIVSVIDTENGNYIDCDCEIKIRGNTTAKALKKPYNIKFSKKTAFLGMAEGKKWCLLANQFDKSLMRNYLVLCLGEKLGLEYTSQCKFADVYVNGIYNGNYLVTEAVEVKKNRVEVDADNENSSDVLIEVGSRGEEGIRAFRSPVYNILFDINDPEEDDLTPEKMDIKVENICSFLEEFETALHKRKYDDVKKYFDEQSFVDFFICCEYFKNVDFNFSSTRFYIKDEKLYAGPLWDFDLSSGNCNPDVYIDYYIDGDSTKGIFCDRFVWYSKLMEMKGFKKALKKRYLEIKPVIKNIYSKGSKSEGSIDYALDCYGASFVRNYIPKEQYGAGWSIISTEEKMSYSQYAGFRGFDDAVKHLRSWLKDRDKFLTEYFRKAE